MGYNSHMSKLFIFDMGEVLLLDVRTLPKIAERLSLNYSDLHSDWKYYDVPLMDGFMKPDDYYRHLELAFDLPRIEEDLFNKYFDPHPNTFMLEEIEKLKAKGHRVVVGSNTFAPHWEGHILAYPWLDLFDSLYASHLIHIAKPFPAFWRYIMKKEGFSPEDTVFIDDRAENIDAARSLGVEAFQYLRNNNEIASFFSHYL